MKWYAISGSWRKTNAQVEKDVEDVVKGIVFTGCGIVTGGALGVDFIATQVVLNEGDVEGQLRIYLPVTLERYFNHYEKRTLEGVITQKQSDDLVFQLKNVFTKSKGKSILDDACFTEVNAESYYARNKSIIGHCDELYAFQVNESKGTQNAIDYAKELGKRISLRKYFI